ncbi:MAG: succinate dehydrogenase, cytochrome b556 subunit [Gammaproteobacteria bacterium RIFCSPHIGHO2_12_FULL_41_15]|nr:MAG: succinate dehydrogenase, cytochrome b556 subunit [Gammaproteobacteria bacterium RIFCSPHIGHO2_12_FULL_41_15]
MDLNLFHVRFPVMAIVSILHRITGVITFLALPVLLYLLNTSLLTQTSFDQTIEFCRGGFCKLFLWAVLVCMIFHLLAGIRHIIMDFGVGESVTPARFTAFFLLGTTLIFAILAGAWIW